MAAKEKQKGKMDVQQMIETYRKLGMPGAPHKLLAKLAGSWDTITRSWMEPGTAPVESSGTSENRMILGGRFLHQEFVSEMMGNPFTGIGVTGYDNHTGKYVSTWMDSMGTNILLFEGTEGEDGKTIIQESRYDDPFKGPMKWRSVTKLVDENTHLFEMFAIDKTGNEEKMMEITYTRKK